MPHRMRPQTPSGPPLSTQLAFNVDKPLAWLLAALRRGRGERRTQVQDPAPPPPPAAAGPMLLYPVEATAPMPPLSAPSPSRRLHPISLETTAVPPSTPSPSR